MDRYDANSILQRKTNPPNIVAGENRFTLFEPIEQGEEEWRLASGW